MNKSRTLRHLRAIGTGVKHLFSNRLTCPYPDARQAAGERYRGMIVLSNDKCTSCSLCARTCPSNAIKMQMWGEKKFPGVDYARCVFCGFCVDVCPVKALVHTSLHDVAYLGYEENLFPPEKLVEGGKDPYHILKGVVAVGIHEKKGLVYGKPETPPAEEKPEEETKPAPREAEKPPAEVKPEKPPEMALEKKPPEPEAPPKEKAETRPEGEEKPEPKEEVQT